MSEYKVGSFFGHETCFFADRRYSSTWASCYYHVPFSQFTSTTKHLPHASPVSTAMPPRIQATLIPSRAETYGTPADKAACFFSQEELAEARREERSGTRQRQEQEEQAPQERQQEVLELQEEEQQERQNEEEWEEQQPIGFGLSAIFSLLRPWFAQFQPQQQP